MSTSLIKQPSENRLYDMDFSFDMQSGETISSVISITDEVVSGVDAVGLSFGTPVISGQIAQFTVSGGVNGVVYKITVKIVTSRDPVKEGEGYLIVQDI